MFVGRFGMKGIKLFKTFKEINLNDLSDLYTENIADLVISIRSFY